jgi:hypothetical protein
MTADPWLPGANHVPGNHAAGLSLVGGNCLLTHHITVSPKTSFASTRDYLVHEGYEPTLLLDPWEGHRAQFVPGDRGAYALMHPAGCPETNREGRIHIQVEWLCPDMNTDITTAPHFAGQWRDLCVWSHALGVPYVWTFGHPLNTSRDPQTWKRGGHRGHRNAPDNDHVDSLPCVKPPAWPAAPAPPAPTPAPTVEDEAVKVIRIKGTAPQFISNGITRRWISSPQEKTELVAAGLIDNTVHDLDAAVVNAIPLTGPAPH